MSDQINSTSSSAYSEASSIYVPNPAAAKLIAALIQTGYFPSSIPDCMTGYWPLALAEIQSIADKGERARFQAFSAFTADLPKEQSWGMMNEVRQLLLPMVNRTEKDRQLFWAKDAMSSPPALEWVVPGLFARPSFNLLVGNPGSKKTYLAMDLAACIANGTPWLNFPLDHSPFRGKSEIINSSSPPLSREGVRGGVSSSPVPVLFIDEESGYLQMWRRFNSVLHAHKSDSAAPLAYTSLAGYNLCDPDDTDALMKRALSIKAGLIIIDALSDLLHTSDNNSLQPVLFNLRRLADTCHAAIIVIHHNNREGGYSGSSAIAASVDLMLEVSSSPSDSLIEFRPIKARFQAPDPFYALAHFERSEGEREGTPTGHPRVYLTATEGNSKFLKEPPSGVLPGIVNYLSKHRQATTLELMSWLSDRAPGTVRNAVHQLVITGRIKRINPTERGKPAVFVLAEGEKSHEIVK